MKRTPIKDLIFGADESQPQYYNWYENYHKDAYTLYQATDCGECGKLVVCNSIGHNTHSELDAESECEGFLDSSGPIVNYYYPFTYFRGDPNEAALAIADLPLCLVYFEDNNLREEESYALALTGCGMDLSWEICEAFMRLGYLPPAHCAVLPRMCDRGKSKRDKWILAGCRRVFREHIRHARNNLRSLKNYGIQRI